MLRAWVESSESLCHIYQDNSQLRKKIKGQTDEGNMKKLITLLETDVFIEFVKSKRKMLCSGRVTCGWSRVFP